MLHQPLVAASLVLWYLCSDCIKVCFQNVHASASSYIAFPLFPVLVVLFSCSLRIRWARKLKVPVSGRAPVPHALLSLEQSPEQQSLEQQRHDSGRRGPDRGRDR